jgi:hypothetical protein
MGDRKLWTLSAKVFLDGEEKFLAIMEMFDPSFVDRHRDSAGALHYYAIGAEDGCRFAGHLFGRNAVFEVVSSDPDLNYRVYDALGFRADVRLEVDSKNSVLEELPWLSGKFYDYSGYEYN